VSVSCPVSLSGPAEWLQAALKALTCMFVGPVGFEPTTYGLGESRAEIRPGTSGQSWRLSGRIVGYRGVGVRV
jgi:hypothetical protein